MSNELNPLTSLFAKPATPSEPEPDLDSGEGADEKQAEGVSASHSGMWDANAFVSPVTGDKVIDDHSIAGAKPALPPLGSIQDLANLDTDAIEALRGKADRYVKETEKFVLREAEGVASVCNALDSLMEGDERLDFIDLSRARNYVQTLMTTLRVRPEFDSVLLDRDVRNILAWAKQNYESHKETAELKNAGKAGSAVSTQIKNATKRSRKSSVDLSSLATLDINDIFNQGSK